MFLPFKRAFPAMFEVYWDHRNVSDKPCDLRPSISTQSIGVRRSIKVGRKDVLLSINSNNKKKTNNKTCSSDVNLYWNNLIA